MNAYLIKTEDDTLLASPEEVVELLTRWCSEEGGPINVFIEKWQYNEDNTWERWYE